MIYKSQFNRLKNACKIRVQLKGGFPMKGLIKTLFLNFSPRALLRLLKKWHYVRELENFNENDEKDLIVVKKLVEKGEVAVDIGANVGIYTKILSEKVMTTGHVYSIEPVPQTFSLLLHCVKKLGMANVKLFNIGISDSNRTVSMVVPPYASGGENFYMAHIVAGSHKDVNENTFEVKVKTLDSLFSELDEKITFIKCDVEGHEWPVICGARKTIERTKPAWLIEISDSPDTSSTDARKVFSYFQENGYLPFWFDGNILRKRTIGTISVNYFFLTQEHIRRVESAGIKILGHSNGGH